MEPTKPRIKPGPKRTRRIKLENLSLEAQWDFEHIPHDEITRRINEHNKPAIDAGTCRPITIHQIRQDLIECRRKWTQSILWTTNEARAREYRHFHHVRMEAWKAWYKSLEPSERKTLFTEGEKTVKGASITSEKRCGDVSFLNTVTQNTEAICRLFGLNLDKPVEITADGKQKISVAFVLNTGGKTLEEVTDFPIIDTPPDGSRRPATLGNGESEDDLYADDDGGNGAAD